jgi:hypothetical protein
MKMHNWEICCTSDEFEKVKSDESFLGILTLARCVNALRFCQKAVLDCKGAPHPSGARTSINLFLFAGSILYEGFLLIERLGRYYKDLESFRKGFGTLLRDKAVTELRHSILKRARNSFVFHFDDSVAKESLQTFEVPTICFASGYGDATGEMYFGLADEIAIYYLLKPEENETDDSLRKRHAKIVKETTEVIGKFTQSAEFLMADVIKGMGFIVKKLNR